MIPEMNNLIMDMASTHLDKSKLEVAIADSELREAAEQFEAIFLNQWIQQARNTKLAEDILGSSSIDKYQEMLDREYASSLASGVNLGIAEALIRQFEGKGK
tara:strand:+ start:162 stop:467 length:306 start_codon:yes stop_codon:yes gene_type:complete